MRVFLLFLCFYQNILVLFSQKVLWEKTYHKSGFDQFSCLQPTPDGGCIAGGSAFLVFFKDNQDLAPGSRGNDFCLLKLNSSGDIQWEKTYGGLDWDELIDIKLTNDGGYILGGYTRSTDGDIHSANKGESDCWIVKVDAKGNIEWEKTYGGSKEERLTSLINDRNGGYLFTATTRSTDGDVGSTIKEGNAIWVVKLDAKGVIKWKNIYAQAGTISENVGIVSNAKGYMLFASTFLALEEQNETEKQNRDARIFKLNRTGKVLWEKTYGGSKNERIIDLKNTPDKGFVFVGASKSTDCDVKSGNKGNWDGWLVKLDTKGIICWEKTFGGKKMEQFSSLLITKTGYVLGASSSSSDGDIHNSTNNVTKFWMLQTDFNGNLLSEQTFATENTNFLNCICPATGGGYFLGGYESFIVNGHQKAQFKVLKIKQ